MSCHGDLVNKQLSVKETYEKGLLLPFSISEEHVSALTSRRVRVGLGLGLFRCEETYCSLSDCGCYLKESLIP